MISKDNYLMFMDWLKSHSINKIPYKLFIKFEIGQINYKELFDDFNIPRDFSLQQVDNLIKNSRKVMKKYEENIIFQYIYLILSPYKFNEKNSLVNAFTVVHKLILNEEYEKVDEFLKTFDINTVNSKEYVSYVENMLNLSEELGNLENSNILETQLFIANTLKMLFVHKGNIELDEFIKNVKNIGVDRYSINLLITKCKNSKIKFFEYMKNYYNNRFLYHGTNSKWLNNIKRYGLNGIRSFDYQQEISKAIGIFESYGIYNTFWGKNSEKWYFSYFVTDSIQSAVYYAHQSPEYFSKFCANGYCMKQLKKCDHEAFWRRDFDACLNNVYILCKSIKMAETDIQNLL